MDMIEIQNAAAFLGLPREDIEALFTLPQLDRAEEIALAMQAEIRVKAKYLELKQIIVLEMAVEALRDKMGIAT